MIRVLVVEDEPVAAQAHRAYVERVTGFEVAGVVDSGRDALRVLRQRPDVDLVLLDFNLPDLHGLEVCRAMRAAGVRADVDRGDFGTRPADHPLRRCRRESCSTCSSPSRSHRSAASSSATPSTAPRWRRAGVAAGQDDVDRAFAALRGLDRGILPPGLIEETFEAVARVLQQAADTGLSAAEVGEVCGISRVTARRYLEHLAESGVVRRTPRYRGTGRPEIEYRWEA